MPITHQNTSNLLEVIPSSKRTPAQVSWWCTAGDESPTYRLLRKPVNLQELNKFERPYSIWRDNETLAYVIPHNKSDFPDDERNSLQITYAGTGPDIYIFGDTDTAIAETTAFFLELEGSNTCEDRLEFQFHGHQSFNFRDAGSQCIMHMLKIAPSRDIYFRNITISTDQSLALATSKHPKHIYFFKTAFEDEGSAFVDALETRQSSFGSLTFEETSPGINDNNLQRLFRVSVIEHLGLPVLSEATTLLSLAAKVDSLDCLISSSLLQKVDLPSLSIVTNKLDIGIDHDTEEFPTELMISFWRRLAALGHFEELKVTLFVNDCDVPDSIVQEMIAAVNANSKLKVLDLSSNTNWDWSPHMEAIFQGIKGHKELRTLRIDVFYS
ncbi:hypothetical protein FisN_11Hu203 [Fistulifera solaris]|uniref:Uncharacterized protein n=1 Tax=Fistulifera solaris TaxID=1519565 RepID=A0A1Z5JL03_FISSO|nr:hypothetical protein FisN_11Hu203 [Fistulifera solaris]|eukprot:GAX14664.1 hypothetical protein FisN_11Hu203 [Fistulifera solaris]